MKKQNVLIILITVLILAIIGAGQYYFNKKTDIQIPVSSPQAIVTIEQTKAKTTQAPSAVVQTGDISVILDFGKGTPITGLVYAQNAFAALKEIAKAKSLEVSVKQYKYGSLVEKIGDTAGTKDNFWAYYVNGELGNVASDKFIIHPKDVIVWKYEKINK